VPRYASLRLADRSYPELFSPDLAEKEADAYTTTEKYDIVNSCATLYPTTASRLTSINDSPIPPTEALASLIALEPKIARVEQQQEQCAGQVAELRLRTSSLLERWYRLSLLSVNECWAEWEERLLEVEKKVRRHEVIKVQTSQTV
jgi:hypothetical protein